MKGFFAGVFLGAAVGAACGTFLTPGANKNIRAIQSEMNKMRKKTHRKMPRGLKAVASAAFLRIEKFDFCRRKCYIVGNERSDAPCRNLRI